MSALEDRLLAQVKAAGLPVPERELRVLAGRRFRIDFAWPAARLAVEVDGGAFVGGRHTRGIGFTQDAEKSNLLALEGWRVLHVTAPHVRSGQALAWIRAALADDREGHR
jgi:very-short-patch-repair endonuclease